MKSICLNFSVFVAFAFLTSAQGKALRDNGDNTPSISHRIVGGQIAEPNQFPYQALIRMTKIRDGDIAYDSWCGGSLISDKVVLTAAHCLKGAVSVTVYLGAHNRDADEEPGRVIIYVNNIKDIITHKDFNPRLYDHDIALVILPERVKLTDKIKTVDLPRSSEERLDGKMAITSGWGKTGDYKPMSDILRFVQRKIFRNEYCAHFYGRLRDSQLCVDGARRKSTCAGDSGGPLVIEENDGTKTLVGITSFGTNTCERDIPSVFTRVSSYLEWINEHSGIPVKK